MIEPFMAYAFAAIHIEPTDAIVSSMTELIPRCVAASTRVRLHALLLAFKQLVTGETVLDTVMVALAQFRPGVAIQNMICAALVETGGTMPIIARGARLLEGLRALRAVLASHTGPRTAERMVERIPALERAIERRDPSAIHDVLARDDIRWVISRGGPQWYADFLRGRGGVETALSILR